VLLVLAAAGPVRAADGSLQLPSDPLTLLQTLGFPVVALVLFLREEVVPKGRLKAVEAQRDEAIAGWKAQAAATTQVAELTKALLAKE
jgi:hypothetical protein